MDQIYTEEQKLPYIVVYITSKYALQNKKVGKHKYKTKDWYVFSGATLLFEHLPSRASDIEHFEIFSHPQENQLA